MSLYVEYSPAIQSSLDRTILDLSFHQHVRHNEECWQCQCKWCQVHWRLYLPANHLPPLLVSRVCPPLPLRLLPPASPTTMTLQWAILWNLRCLQPNRRRTCKMQPLTLTILHPPMAPNPLSNFYAPYSSSSHAFAYHPSFNMLINCFNYLTNYSERPLQTR